MRLSGKFKKIFSLILAGVLLVSLLSGCGNTKYIIETGRGAKAVFRVNEELCSVSEAKIYLAAICSDYEDYYGINLWQAVTSGDASATASADASGDSAYENLETYVRDKTMSRLQNIFCMYLLAQERGISLTEKQTLQIQQAAAEYYNSMDDQTRKYLSVSQNDIEKYYTQYAYAEKLYQDLTSDVDLEISDDEARVMDVQVIYTTSKTTVSAIESALSEGTEFASVASSYTELSEVTMTIARGDLPDQVTEAAFNLDQDQVSDVISTDDGYYFVKCITKIDQELTEENRQKILEEATEAAFDEVYDAYVEDLLITVNEKVWDSIDISQLEDIDTADFFDIYNSYFSEE